jgi:hypothetical protein
MRESPRIDHVKSPEREDEVTFRPAVPMVDYLLCKAQEAEQFARTTANDAEKAMLLEKAKFFRSQARLELRQSRSVN